MKQNHNKRPILLALALALIGLNIANSAPITVGPGGPPTYDHANIQDAINAATAGDIVSVAPGTYGEQIIINKQISLLGPYENLPGYDGGRVPSEEAVIQFPAGAANGSGLIFINPNVHGVTIAGFDLRCQDATIPNYHQLIRAGGFSAGQPRNDLTIRNNRMYSSEEPIRILAGFGADNGTGLLIEGNYIDSGPNVNALFGRGMYVGGTSGIIQDNVVVNAKMGIQYMPYDNANVGLIRRNTVSASTIGLYHNYQTIGAANVTWEQNEVAVAPNPQTGLSAAVDFAMTDPAIFHGIYFNTFGTQGFGAPPVALFQNNTINAANPGDTTSTVFLAVFLENSAAGATAILENNSFTGYTAGVVRAANATDATVIATCNWWGSDALAVVTAAAGPSTFLPYLTDGTDAEPSTIGFQPVPNSCNGWPVSVYSELDAFVSGHTTIQAAINDAGTQNGYLVRVQAGTYAEGNITINKALDIRGANFDIRANDPGAMADVNPARGAESILSGTFLVQASDVSIDGFAITGNSFAVQAPGTGQSNVSIRNNLMYANTGGRTIEYWSSAQNATNWTITGNHISDIQATDATAITVFNITGLEISDNTILHANTAFNGRRGMNVDGGRNVKISGNLVNNGLTEVTFDNSLGEFAAARYQLQLSSSNRSTEEVVVEDNVFGGAYDGIITLGNGDYQNIDILNNKISGNVVGIRFQAGTNGPDGSHDDFTIIGNDIEVPHYAIFLQNGAPNPDPYSKIVINGNSIIRITPGLALAVHSEALLLPEGPVDATKNYWGAPNPAFDSILVGNLDYSPWYADEALTILVTADNFTDQEVQEGSTVEEDDLFIGGGTYTVIGTLIVNGELTLADGAFLNVINGDLVLNGSTLSGSFTFFNSMGSVFFNDDVSITGSATGLILIADVHVADEATIAVSGTLVIDGCVVDSDGRFELVVGTGANFTMARTVFANGDIEVESGDTAIYDNRFENSTIEVLTGTTGARIFHNITDDLGWLTDDGNDTVTSVDGWGNVTDAAETENNLALGLDISGLPVDRTQDLDGNVFIQPGDSVFAMINVSDLQAQIAAVEVLLGYNTTLIDVATLGLADDWNVLIDSVEDDSNAIGLLDAAIGLSFSFGDPSGSDADQEIGDVELTAGLDEGETLFFHRVKLSTDTFGGETRLTTGGPTPAFLTPFTSNSAMITIDGTDPLIADPADYATIEQFVDDVNTDTTPAAVTIQGVVDITASAFDALAGIEDAKAVVTLVGPDTYTATQTGTLAGPSIGGDDYTTYTFTYAVDSTTLNGTYDVVFTVTDRSGNQTVETLGSILINKNQVEVDIELQGLVAGPITRDVEFVFTDSLGAEIETRIEPVEFTGGVGSVTFTDVDGDTFRLSAKTAWNLRKRLEVGLDADGLAAVDFTGANLLRGGDLNNDNVVNTLDYSILRFYWFTTNPTADITGDDVVNLDDFNILKANFYQAGDPK